MSTGDDSYSFWLRGLFIEPSSKDARDQDAARVVMAAFGRSPSHREVLAAIAGVMGTAGWVTGGFVRESVWDFKSGITVGGWNSDVDVVYFDRASILKNMEREWEDKLRAANPSVRWSVKNQARMHLVNGDKPYVSLLDALTRFPETASAVAVQAVNGRFNVVAPYGLRDLVGLIYRKSPGASSADFVRRRSSVYRDDRWTLREES